MQDLDLTYGSSWRVRRAQSWKVPQLLKRKYLDVETVHMLASSIKQLIVSHIKMTKIASQMSEITKVFMYLYWCQLTFSKWLNLQFWGFFKTRKKEKIKRKKKSGKHIKGIKFFQSKKSIKEREKEKKNPQRNSEGTKITDFRRKKVEDGGSFRVHQTCRKRTAHPDSIHR